MENATSSSFYICLRELQNYDGLHEDIFVVILQFLFLKRDIHYEHERKKHGNQGFNEPGVKERQTVRKKIFNQLGLIKNSIVLFSYSPEKKSSHYKNIAALCFKF